MKEICLNCTLKRSPEESSAAIGPGSFSEAVVHGDAWLRIRERILAAGILVIATPARRRLATRPVAQALQTHPIPAPSQS